MSGGLCCALIGSVWLGLCVRLAVLFARAWNGTRGYESARREALADDAWCERLEGGGAPRGPALDEELHALIVSANNGPREGDQ